MVKRFAEDTHKLCLIIFAAQVPQCLGTVLSSFPFSHFIKEQRLQVPGSARGLRWGWLRTAVGLGGSRAGGAGGSLRAAACSQSVPHTRASLLLQSGPCDGQAEASSSSFPAARCFSSSSPRRQHASGAGFWLSGRAVLGGSNAAKQRSGISKALPRAQNF